MPKRSIARLGATGSGLRLSDYPLGSPQSRAAARAFLEAQKAAQGEGTLLIVRTIGKPHDPDRNCICRTPEAGTIAVCRCFL
jgi:RecB family exonuclease